MERFWVLVVLVAVTGCRSVRYVPVETVRTEREYVDRWKRDSVYVRDSVFVLVKGDTVFRDRWRAVYRDRYVRDTAYVERVDSVQVPYPVEKPLRRMERVYMEAGKVAVWGGVVAGIVAVAILRRRKRRLRVES